MRKFQNKNNNMIGDKQKIYFIADIAAHISHLRESSRNLDLAKEMAVAGKFTAKNVEGKNFNECYTLSIFSRGLKKF